MDDRIIHKNYVLGNHGRRPRDVQMGIKSMKLPLSCRILGTKYKVRIRSNLKLEGNYVNGYIDFDLKVIFISKQAKNQWGTFLHEVQHGIIFELKIPEEELQPIVEEIVVENIQQWMFKNFEMKWKGSSR